jgi:hypothetical protein
VLLFRVLVPQTLCTRSDGQTGHQLQDRLSFMRFVGRALHGPPKSGWRAGASSAILN